MSVMAFDKGEMMTTTIQEAIAMTALNNLFKKGHFDICTIDAVAKVLGVHPTRHEYVMLHALHCIDYKDMPKEVYEALPAMVKTCLSMNDIYEFDHVRPTKILVSPFQRVMKAIGGT